MRSACGSRRGSLLSSGGMVGSLYVMESRGKYIITWVSSNIVLYGVSFVVHSSSGTVRMVIVSWFSCAARQAQCMAFCVFSLNLFLNFFLIFYLKFFSLCFSQFIYFFVIFY